MIPTDLLLGTAGHPVHIRCAQAIGMLLFVSVERLLLAGFGVECVNVVDCNACVPHLTHDAHNMHSFTSLLCTVLCHNALKVLMAFRIIGSEIYVGCDNGELLRFALQPSNSEAVSTSPIISCTTVMTIQPSQIRIPSSPDNPYPTRNLSTKLCSHQAYPER